ncbi:aflatoxin biosynthesis ketoreductase nor-1 [Colletotrichum kahawae]|uniref:Aflatoxin biosynthesis ketoreductase nor-1 n=1 Tax=Colletotrichum kahawae TaxID=34407 RepID=A0AAE0CY55_COLKA|nr:aflatoxin biosynthesis ketoreductase nor-1 [Colletotrichum kahawae]
MSANQPYLSTGANRGIGKGFVTALLARPSTTVIAGVRDPSASSSKALASLPKDPSSTLILVKIDSSVDADPAAAIALLQKDHAITAIDTVIANAGISHTSGPVRELASAPALDHFRVNAVAPVLPFGAAAPLLRKSANPVFVAISSAIGSVGMQERLAKLFPPGVGLSPYGASKATLNWLVKRLSVEEDWVTAFVFHPGLGETDMSAALAEKNGVADAKSLGAITVETSVGGMVKVIDGATREVSGKFKNYDGTDLPW